ncbi:unnamed protein product [Effrenium voratum]|uniref:Uncharacterized protein n=1 Tax=Effrenium voratum TaxID=2562239 RepID=A0AA36IDW2_9DINO|nr:unnamed protein product [Effrenium voratum]
MRRHCLPKVSGSTFERIACQSSNLCLNGVCSNVGSASGYCATTTAATTAATTISTAPSSGGDDCSPLSGCNCASCSAGEACWRAKCASNGYVLDPVSSSCVGTGASEIYNGACGGIIVQTSSGVASVLALPAMLAPLAACL